MDGNEAALCLYRLNQAQETLEVANECYQNNHYKDSINRSYYAAFYSIKAILALEKIDFKRHKDVVAYFNKQYVASGIFAREIGRNLGRLKNVKKAITTISILHLKKRLKSKLPQLCKLYVLLNPLSKKAVEIRRSGSENTLSPAIGFHLI